MTNLLTRVPRRVQPWVATMVRTIYQKPSPDEVHAQLDRVTDQLQDRSPQVASLLDEAGPDILAFSNFPVSHWTKIWSNNPLERLNKGRIRWEGTPSQPCEQLVSVSGADRV